MLNITHSSAEDAKRAGMAHYQAGRFPQGLAAFELATRLDPASAAARHNVGLGLFSLRRCDESVWHFERALAIDSRLALAWNSLGAALLETGQAQAAVRVLRRGVELHPQEPAMHSFLICALALAGATRAQVMAETAAFAGRFRLLPRPAVPGAVGRPLRVGFVSADFRTHAVAWFFEPLLRELPRLHMRALCYCHAPAPDATTQRLRELTGADAWRDIAALDDDAAADLIRRDQLDVLVDLMGHTAGNRLGIFARRPAGVQVSWLGYAGPAPLPTIDARLTDALLDPDAPSPADPVAALDVFASYMPPRTHVETMPPQPASRPPTLACVSNPLKWSPEFLAACSAILDRLPAARLLMILPGMDPIAMARIQRQFSPGAASRIAFVGSMPFEQYLAMHNDVDILLDTFPISGHTVTCHALWMGVPVVTRAGQTPWERLSASVLAGMNKRAWIAETDGAFVDAAVRLAVGPPEDRRALRAAFLSSPAADAAALGRSFERVLRAIVEAIAARQA
ncbi:MAG TPA: hypothetical protein VH253_08595 [Phycisphaerae bacterium]|nr:hypothetical protein [Phycisphaerae bacterium]